MDRLEAPSPRSAKASRCRMILLWLLMALNFVGADRSMDDGNTHESPFDGVGLLSVDVTQPGEAHTQDAVDVNTIVGTKAGTTGQTSKTRPAQQFTESLRSVSKVAVGRLIALATESHALATKAWRSSSTARRQIPFMSGLSVLRGLGKMCLACTCLMVIWKALGKCKCCESKTWDVRRCAPMARFLRYIEFDEFEAFSVFVKVHSVQDVVHKSLLGDKAFSVTVKFKWSKFETPPTKNLRWEAYKQMEVPQGAPTCRIQLRSLGTIKDSPVAELELETKRDMLDQGENFFNKKQRLKMEKGGQAVATLNITFRNNSSAGEDDEQVGLPISGVSDDSALYQELLDVYDDYQRQPGWIPLQKGEKLEGDRKCMLLAKCLAGQLREVDVKTNKDQGHVYVTVRYCNYAELRGADMEKEMVKQVEKAKAKGLSQPQRKWYWAWYEDKQQAEHMQRWHFPDGFLPIVSITNIHKDPTRIDQFMIKYADSEHQKEIIAYRRTGGKALDVWIEGLTMLKDIVKQGMLDAKDKAADDEQAMQRLRMLNRQFIKQNGLPNTPDGWKVWYTWLKDTNKYPDELIRKLKVEIDAAGKGKAKGK